MGETKRPRKRPGQAKDSKRVRKEMEVDRKAQELTSLIFGGDAEDNATAAQEQEDDRGIVQKRIAPSSLLSKSFVTDSAHEEASSDDESDDDEPKSATKTSVWEDPDNSMVRISGDDSGHRLKKLRDTREAAHWRQSELEQRLRQRYEKTAVRTSQTNWAAVDPIPNTQSTDKGEDDNDFLESESGVLFAKNRNRIPSNIIDMVRLKDANVQDPCGGVLRCVSFHQMSDPDEPLLMTAGLDKTIR